MQNQVEQQYDQMMQEGGIFGEPMNETIKARKGMIVGDDLPRGFYKRSMKRFGNIPNLREVDVRKSGLFGPKQYTMYFDPLPLQQLNNPMSAQMYGYGSSSTASRKQTRTFDAVKTYTNLATDAINNESLKEVDKNTPGNDATKVEEKSITEQTYVNPVVKSNTTVENVPTNNLLTQQVVKDAWGRPEGSEWFGFNPKTKKWENGSKPIDLTPGLTKIKNDIESYVPFSQEWNKYLTSIGFKQIGGSVDDPFVNPMEPLQRFIGGGYDPSINDLSENQIQYMDSKDVTDPYMQGGGFIKNFIPANLTRSSQNDVVQRVYNPVTGQTRQGGPGAGNYISAIDVRKRGITGTPKKYTIYYGAAGDPRYENLISLDGAKGAKSKDSKATEKSERQQALENAGYGQRTDVTGLKGKSKRAIRQGERQRDRELEKLYEEDPTSVEFDPINIDAPFDRTASNNRAYNVSDLSTPTTEEDFATWGTPREAMETQTAYQFPEGDYNDDAGWGTAGVPMTQFNAYGIPESAEDDAAWGMPQDMVVNPFQQESEQVITETVDTPYMGGMTSDFGPMSMEGPMATAEDQVPTLEEQYMEGFQPTITRDMIDQASGLRIPQEPVNMGAWSGMSYPGMPIQPGLNPFDLPVGGGQDYYPPFAQPIASRNDQSINRPAPSGPTLDQLRAQNRNNPNAGKDYTFKPNMAGIEKDPDYRRAMQNASKDGTITNQEVENATRIFKQKQAQQEKDKIASQAQRTINQIMNSSASAAEKNKAREKVVLQMQQRWDVIDRAANSRKYGGALSKFVGGGNNQPFTGESPIAYTNNPMMQGKSDLDLISLNSGIQGAQGQVNWGSMSSPGTVNQRNNDGSMTYGVDATYKGPQAPEIKIDPMQQEEFQVAKTYSEPLAIDVKNKLSQGEREARLIAGNSLMRGIAGYKNRIDDTKQMEGFYDNLTADNLYASDPSRDRGDYAESGLYRPDEQGQTWYGRSAQMGGYVDDDFEDGEEVYMTDEEIKEYMANGGQIEFI